MDYTKCLVFELLGPTVAQVEGFLVSTLPETILRMSEQPLEAINSSMTPAWDMEVMWHSIDCFRFFISIHLILSPCDCTHIATDISGSSPVAISPPQRKRPSLKSLAPPNQKIWFVLQFMASLWTNLYQNTCSRRQCGLNGWMKMTKIFESLTLERVSFKERSLQNWLNQHHYGRLRQFSQNPLITESTCGVQVVWWDAPPILQKVDVNTCRSMFTSLPFGSQGEDEHLVTEMISLLGGLGKKWQSKWEHMRLNSEQEIQGTGQEKEKWVEKSAHTNGVYKPRIANFTRRSWAIETKSKIHYEVWPNACTSYFSYWEIDEVPALEPAYKTLRLLKPATDGDIN